MISKSNFITFIYELIIKAMITNLASHLSHNQCSRFKWACTNSHEFAMNCIFVKCFDIFVLLSNIKGQKKCINFYSSVDF